MDDIDKILFLARNSISSYCINECKANCCKTGKLFLFSIDELTAVTIDENLKYTNSDNITKNEFGNFYFNLETNGGCPNLDSKTSFCKIHKDKNKPRICSDFPLFKAKEYVVSAGVCPAVQNKLFEKYFKELEKLGIKVV